MDGKTLARIGAVAFVAIAIVATAIEMNRHDDPQSAAPTQASPAPERDPLDAELARCSGIGEAGSRDPACLKTWAENRRRFLGQPAPPRAAASAPSAAPTTLFPSEASSAELSKPAAQPDRAQPEKR